MRSVGNLLLSGPVIDSVDEDHVAAAPDCDMNNRPNVAGDMQNIRDITASLRKSGRLYAKFEPTTMPASV